jgi:4-hydroxy-3-methylbut-2-enyl diphosphate reductase
VVCSPSTVPFSEGLRSNRILERSGLREVLFTLGWGFFLAMLPAATLSHNRLGPSILPWPVSLMALFFARSLFVDLVDLQGDALLGMDTLPLKLGGKRCRTLLLLCLLLASLIHPAGWLLGNPSPVQPRFVAGPWCWQPGWCSWKGTCSSPRLGVRSAADGSLLRRGFYPPPPQLLLCRAGLS